MNEGSLYCYDGWTKKRNRQHNHQYFKEIEKLSAANILQYIFRFTEALGWFSLFVAILVPGFEPSSTEPL